MSEKFLQKCQKRENASPLIGSMSPEHKVTEANQIPQTPARF
jgi:hypothetical protein